MPSNNRSQESNNQNSSNTIDSESKGQNIYNEYLEIIKRTAGDIKLVQNGMNQH